jgi:hypothetical protein
MVLIQLLLPVNTSGGQDAARQAVALTRRELTDRFGGLTAYLRAPAVGVWTSPDGEREQDDVVMVEIVTDRFDRAWWREYARTLAGRFTQEAIHVRALTTELLDDEAR